MATCIHRVTMFKIPDPDSQDKLLEAYKLLAKEQSKDGKPYIKYLCAGRAMEDPRAQGYTVVVKMEFDSLDDMRFYDQGCAAHDALKNTASTLGVTAPPLSTYFEGRPVLQAD